MEKEISQSHDYFIEMAKLMLLEEVANGRITKLEYEESVRELERLLEKKDKDLGE